MRKGLEPIIDRSTEILILGSFPSEMSLKKGEYYGNPSNDFWRIMGYSLGLELPKMAYHLRISSLLKNRIGLWDVFLMCEREGSSDSNIRRYELNDFSKLNFIAPSLNLIILNGKKAGEYQSYLKGYETRVLPSTSGANRRENPVRYSAWRSVIG